MKVFRFHRQVYLTGFWSLMNTSENKIVQHLGEFQRLNVVISPCVNLKSQTVID